MRTAIVCLALVSALLRSNAFAQMPRTIAYQGIMSDTSGTPKPDGVYTFTFRIYSTGTGGTPVWTEIKDITVKKGLFFTSLGDVTPFPATLKFDLACWLGVKVGADPELAPRIALTSNTSGFYADSTRIAGTVPDNALTGAKIATNQVVKSINGLKDAVTLSAGQNISIVLQGNSIGISATGGGNVSSSGSVASGQMAFWNSASTITADPLLTWDNTNNRLGVNIAAPQTTLDVSGTARASLFSGSGASLTDVPPPPMKYGSSSSGYQLPTDASKVWTPMLLSFTPKISGYVELTYGFSFEWSFGAVSYSQIGVCVSTSNTTPTAGTSLTSHVQIGHMTGVANGSTFKIPVQYSTVLSVISGTTYYVWMGGNLINANTSSSVYFVYPFVVAHLYSSSGL